jgi:hypothetical protein
MSDVILPSCHDYVNSFASFTSSSYWLQNNLRENYKRDPLVPVSVAMLPKASLFISLL